MHYSGYFMKPLLKIFSKNGHFQTLYSFFVRKAPRMSLQFERIRTRDNDFLDLFWHRKSLTSRKLVILTHGLEGHGKQAYILGMAKEFLKEGYDILSWSLRGCSKDFNRRNSFYHGGAIYDLQDVIVHANRYDDYDKIHLVGFSLGGNIVLRYLGNTEFQIPKEIGASAGVSVPCDLKSSTINLDKGFNKIYSTFFLQKLLKRIEDKAARLNILYPFDVTKIKTLDYFNDQVTAKVNGFQDGEDYYKKASSIYYLKNIKVKTLILNAKDDPFLDKNCYPKREVHENPNITLDMPSFGGHVGFYQVDKENYYSEQKCVEFITQA